MADAGFIVIERPFDELADLLSVRPAPWVLSFLRIAAYAGESAAARSLNETAEPGSRQIAVDVLRPLREEATDELAVSIRWHTTGFRWVPPSYAGRIVLRRLSPSASEVALEGSYALPEEARDRVAADASALATEVTVATFLRSFRVAAEEQARDTVPSGRTSPPR